MFQKNILSIWKQRARGGERNQRSRTVPRFYFRSPVSKLTS
jgi:hypothetical protein